MDLRDPRHPRLLRPGAVTRAQLERTLGVRVLTAPSRTKAKTGAQLAPGLLARHYSPRTPVTLHTRLSPAATQRSPASEAWVFLAQPNNLAGKNVYWLDADGELPGVARRLFATLRRVDALRFTRIHVELARGQGLAEAINDRLRRAAAT